MNRDEQFSTLIERLQESSMNRRTMLCRALVMSLSVPAVGSLLAACGDDDDDDDDGAVGEPETPDTGETPEEEGTEEEPAEPTDEGEEEPTEADEAEPTEESEAEPTEEAEDEPSEGEGTRGGTLLVALPGEPPTLDIHQTTAGITSAITWSMYEPLFTFDEEFQLLPMLVESHEISDDGLLNTLHLRQGVLFHNGEEMTAADVVASIERWGSISGLGAGLLEATEEIREVDDYTIEFQMARPFGAFAATLALNYQGCAIYPKSVIDAAGDAQLETEQLIGTGPYRLSERVADQYIRLERFDDYVALPGEPNGYGGHKYQYVDRIEFVPVPDEAARVSGIQAGEYHYVMNISSDQYETLVGSPGVTVERLPPGDWDMIVVNWRSPLTGDLTIRKAIQAAIGCEEILVAAHGADFYRLDPSVMMLESAWHSTVGEELYNQNDPERARQLLEEAGYDGTPLRFLSTQEYQYLYNISVVASQQLEAAGFTVELETFDWATLVERRANPELWDLFPTSIPFAPDPTQLSILQFCTWPGWWCDDGTIETFEQLQQESDFDTRFELWEQIQRDFYEDVPIIKIGDFSSILVMSDKVRGFLPMVQLTEAFWNVWLEE